MTYRLKVHKWVFALIISVVNIFSGYVTPYVIDRYLGGLEQTVVNAIVTLLLNVLVIYLSIEEDNAPTVPLKVS
jgi:hypothetical protein